MNFVFSRERLAQTRWRRVPVIVFVSMAVVCLVSGCSDGVKAISPQEILAFNQIGTSSPNVDLEHLVRARHAVGPYRVVPDDVLELRMPSILQVVTAESVAVEEEDRSLMCRVRDDGTISLPVAGALFVAGYSLAEVEKAVLNTYYPRYTQTPPAVFAQVAQYKTYRVSISGAVTDPGIYELRGDQMSLVALIKEAHGIISEGASCIRIERDNPVGSATSPLPFRPIGGDNSLGGYGKKSVSLAARMASYGIQRGQDSNVHLSFQPQAPRSTIGCLSISREGKIIVQERINLGSEAQRYGVLNRAVQIDPNVSVIDVNTKLISLVSLLYGHVAHYPSVRLASARAEEPGEVPSMNSVVDDIRKIEQYRNEPASMSTSVKDTLVLPVKGTNIPFADVALYEGDSVVVEQLQMPLFAVIGLVNRPGNYEYPPGAQYNLVQAIAFAGGLNAKAEPRFVTVYRTKEDGSIARAVLQLKKGSRLTEELNIPLKRGDVVSVEHTPRTRRNEFIRDTLHFSIGTYINPEQIFNPDTLFNPNTN